MMRFFIKLYSNKKAPVSQGFNYLKRSCLYIIHHSRVKQSTRIAQVGSIALGDLPQNAPHNFARTRLGQPGYKLNFIRTGYCADDACYRHHNILAG